MNWKSEIKSEILALVFGVLIILIMFGDTAQVKSVGNLDMIFGRVVWPSTDVLYPLASIVVFLLYGWSKGGFHLRLNRKVITGRFLLTSVLLFAAFSTAAVLMQLDDFFHVLHHPIEPSITYWDAVRVLYFFTATTTFFAFGQSCKKLNVQ